MSIPIFIPFSVASPTQIWSQAQRSAISQAGPESTMGVIRLGDGSYQWDYSGNTDQSAIVGGMTLNGTLDSPAANSSASWIMGNKPANISYIGAGQKIVNPNDGSWLMAVHSEQWPSGRASDYWSYTSLARSTNNGTSWTFIGHMLKPQFPFDNTQNLGRGYDIGNGCLAPLGAYVYQYYRETTSNNVNGPFPICVARCLASDLFSSSIAGSPTVGTWKKWDGSGWFGDPFTGLGAQVIADPQTISFWPHVCLHSPTGTLFVGISSDINNSHDRNLYLAQSRDGLNFSTPTLVADTASGGFTYGGFRFFGYASEFSGNGVLYLYTPEITTYWSNEIVNRRTITLTTGSHRTNDSRFRGGPACAVMR